MDIETTQGVGVGDSTPGIDSAPPVSPNEPSATTDNTDLNTGAEGSPTSLEGQPDVVEGDKPDTNQPVELTEQEIASLAPKTAQAFARYRTENKGLGEEVASLKSQLAEFQSQQPPAPAIAIDAPVDEWEGLKQFESLPAPYKEKLGNEIGWQRLPTLLNTAIQNIDQLSPEWHKAIVDPLLQTIGADLGLTPLGVIRAIELGVGQLNGEQGQPALTPAQGSQSNLSQQLIAAGYDANDPMVLAAHRQDQQLSQSQRQLAALEQRISKFETENQTQTKAQQERAEKERETEFKGKVDSTTETIIGSLVSTVPKGYERVGKALRAEAKEAIASDSVAQSHLDNARNALAQVYKYRAQGTPELADQAMRTYSAKLEAFAARAAVITQPIHKDHMSLIEENVRLKNGTTQQQQGRKDLIGGSGGGGNGNGFLPRQQGEDMDAYLERARQYRLQETAQLDAQR